MDRSGPRILFVCTANQCRSAIAEALIRNLARRTGTPLQTLSAGTQATDGAEATASSVEALRRHGIDLQQHRSRRLLVSQAEAADLIICMELDHVFAIEELSGPTRKAFLLSELAALVGAAPPEQSWSKWIDHLDRGRTRQSTLASTPTADPTGRSLRHHLALVDSMTPQLTAIVTALPRI